MGFLDGFHQAPYHNPLDYAIWGVLENKTNAISYSNIGSLKCRIEVESNKMSEKFILKTHKSFRMHVDKKLKKLAAILSTFTVYHIILLFIL